LRCDAQLDHASDPGGRQRRGTTPIRLWGHRQRTDHPRRLIRRAGRGATTPYGIQWPGGSQQFVFLADAREAHVDVAEGITTRGIASFFLLGVEHILTGYDHRLFLLALVLRGGNVWSLLKIITAFTVAHSITLALALNIVVVARAPGRSHHRFIHRLRRGGESVHAPHRVAPLGGGIHLRPDATALASSNVLRELGLPSRGWCGLSFNLGVEAGQAIAVVVAVPLLMWLRRYRWEPRAMAAVSM
jgi:hypothetical protein